MYNIGIDLGGTNIKVGVVDESYNIIGRSNIKTNLPRPSEEIADSIVEGVKLACADAKIDVSEVNSIGIGTPGTANRNTGVVLYSCNLGFDNFDLGGILGKKLGTKIYVE
ncbi:MAG: ROK family protein, partial [Ruminiclostridium sp.]